MVAKKALMIPGPTSLPPEVIQSMAKDMINHRGGEFTQMFGELVAGLKEVFQTENDIFVLTGSGTGGMEAAVVNILSVGDEVLVLNIGAFGQRFVKILEVFGAKVNEIKLERGQAVNISILEEKLALDKEKKIKAVFLQHNETSTGVLNDLESIAAVVKKHGALIVVDAISGLLTADLRTDEWGLDVVIAGSQKAFMIPPGLSFVSFSQKAWQAYETAHMPKFYWDFKEAKKFAKKNQTPATPPVSILYGLYQSLKMIKEEGLSNIFKRHKYLSLGTRAGIKALGMKLLAEDKVASRSVTAVFPPPDIEADNFRQHLNKKYNLVLAGGQEELKGKIFRIGHLGYVHKMDIITVLATLELALVELGCKVELASGVKAAEEVFINSV